MEDIKFNKQEVDIPASAEGDIPDFVVLKSRELERTYPWRQYDSLYDIEGGKVIFYWF